MVITIEPGIYMIDHVRSSCVGMHVCACESVHVCMHAYVHASMCVCVCVHTYV